VNQTLKQMTRPPNTPLTRDIVQELCLRAGSKAYVAGAIGALGSEYVLGVKAVNCQSGDLLAQEQVTAAKKEAVLEALGTAATRLVARWVNRWQVFSDSMSPSIRPRHPLWMR